MLTSFILQRFNVFRQKCLKKVHITNNSLLYSLKYDSKQYYNLIKLYPIMIAVVLISALPFTGSACAADLTPIAKTMQAEINGEFPMQPIFIVDNSEASEGTSLSGKDKISLLTDRVRITTIKGGKSTKCLITQPAADETVAETLKNIAGLPEGQSVPCRWLTNKCWTAS